jgi:hypothetical protein
VVRRFKNVCDAPALILDWRLAGGQDHYSKRRSELEAGG